MKYHIYLILCPQFIAGPGLGALLYDVGGFKLPFVIVGSIGIIVGIAFVSLRALLWVGGAIVIIYIALWILGYLWGKKSKLFFGIE
jgi:hypothetical protein